MFRRLVMGIGVTAALVWPPSGLAQDAANATLSQDDIAAFRAMEDETHDHLGELRTAIMTYYADHEDRYPHRLDQLVPYYLAAIPALRLPQHSLSRRVKVGKERLSDDSGGWGYVDNPKSDDHGTVFVNCTHTNQDGAQWYTE